jgi:hypothetical protein
MLQHQRRCSKTRDVATARDAFMGGKTAFAFEDQLFHTLKYADRGSERASLYVMVQVVRQNLKLITLSVSLSTP